MKLHLATGLGAVFLVLSTTGCAMSTDRFGYEHRPFGVDGKFAGTLTVATAPADEIGVKCFNAGGFISPDARACTIPHSDRCTVTMVPNIPEDRRQALLKWSNAICNGWHPGAR